ncbi:hypothetical protein QUF74_08250 [Candidatus Halobeggiatoa sp. HSG11]|nr:hypothetical protein [Candidatus Halobeggiatoa sp. HSG11]
MDETDYQESMLQKIMTAIHKKSIDPTLLSEIKDEAAWTKAKKRFVAEGRKDGIRKGMEKGVLMMAKNMKEAGVIVETIMEVTGLPMEQIESL